MKKILFFLIAAALFAACDPDLYYTRFMTEEELEEYENGESRYVDVSLGLSSVLDWEQTGGEAFSTKAQMLAYADQIMSGAMVLVFRSATGQMDSYRYFTAAELASGAPLKLSVPLARCDFYILGNLPAIRRSDGAAVNLMEALGDGFPMTESVLESMPYVMDGGNLNAAFRRMTMAEVATYGIPFARVDKNVDVHALVRDHGSVLNGECKWLFSKVVVKVNHGLFDGGDASKVDRFVNKSMYMRQVNLRLMPFLGGNPEVKAIEAGDVATGDCDPVMTNGTENSYTFFVPENMQGTVTGIGNSLEKQKNNTSIPAAVRNYATFVEFNGTVAAGGFTGDVKYQFYLGGNATTDFNLQRGKTYDVQLVFSSSNLFAEPEWKVDAALTDHRRFLLTADEANTQTLPDEQVVVVRANRDGAVYVFSDYEGLGANSLKGSGVRNPSWTPGVLADAAFTTDFLSESNVAADVPSRQWLLDRGITPLCDAATGKVYFRVTDEALFNEHIGETKKLTFKLLPDVNGNTASIVVKLNERIGISWDKPVATGFMPGMKRTATLTGFEGEVRYAFADAHTLKNVRTPGSTGLIVSSFSDAQKIGNGTLPVWMYFDFPGGPFNFTFRPVDAFNDGGDIVFPITPEQPWILLDGNTPTDKDSYLQTRVDMEVTGKEETFSFTVRKDGYNGTVVPYSDFDEDCFMDVYFPQISPTYMNATEDMSRYGSLRMLVLFDHNSTYPDYVGTSAKGTLSASGYPEFYMYRKLLGDLFDTRADANVRLEGCSVMFVPQVTADFGFLGWRRYTCTFEARFLPFVSNVNDVTFSGKFHDFTLTPDSDRFDAPYKNYATSYANSTNATFYCTDRTAFDLYAVPQDQGSMSYGVRSESVIISQDADNQPVKLSFVETGSNNHSVGPHKVYAAVRNKWSGEEKTVFLGDIEVYMDFVCGVQYQTTFSGSYETKCYATFLNGAGYFNRTTCDQTLASLNAKVKVMPGFARTDLSSGSSFTTTVTAMGVVSPSSPCVGRVYPAVPGSNNLLYGLTYNYTPGYSGGNITEFAGVIIGNGPTYGPAALAKDCGAHVDMVFTDSVAPYDADVDIAYKAVGSMEDSDNNGYYVFHWLDDVCASSLGWLNVFYDYR